MNLSLKILAALLFLTANFTLAQSSKYELGIEGGPNMTKLRKNNLESFATSEYKVGGLGGITFQSNFRKHFSLRTGILCESRTYYHYGVYQSISAPNIDIYYQTTYNLEYLTIPAMARFTFGKKVQFFFNTGLYFAFSNRVYSSFNLGLSGGAGIGIPIKKHWSLSLEFRDNLEIIDKYRNSDHRFLELLPSNTYAILLGVSYKLGFRDQ